ncbi:MAG: hypothetical protein RLZZ453_351 [Chlamydiota bacterium]|jgi:hypothetical protein
MRRLSYLLLASVAAIYADAPKSKEPYDADLFNKDKRIFFASGEFLYWLANETALDYAIKMSHPVSGGMSGISGTGKYQNAAFHWQPGFRLNIGYFNAPHYWDVFAQYTYVRPYGEVSTQAPTESLEYLNGTWLAPTIETPAIALQSASSTVRLNYNVFDFLLSRRFHTNEHLRLNLFGGLTSAFLHQHWSISYEDIENNTALIRNRWRFDGLGLRLGTKVDWYMGWDIYLVGTFSGGILSGWYKNTEKEVSSFYPTPIQNTVYEDHRLTTTGQMLFGPSWQKRFKTVRTEVVAGYELTAWGNLHEVFRPALAEPQGSKIITTDSSLLTLQGLTVRLTVDF